jgi:hypothetical protein
MTPTSTVAILATFAALASAADAAMVARYSSGFVTSGSDAIPAADFADHVTASDLTPSVGTIHRVGGNANYDGWTPSVDITRYVGFQVSAEPGYRLDLTDFTFRTGATVSPFVDSYVWGMRVDNGLGFGAWSFGTTYTNADPGFSLVGPGDVKTWDFEDFSTTGTVEFGLFASASDSGYMVEVLRTNILNGTVTQVPEPSAAILGIVGCLAFFRRRR